MTTAPAGLSGSGPGIDRELNDKLGQILFSGKLRDGECTVSYSRLVHVVFASKEVFVAIDAIFYNIYVVDRAKNLSLGYRMKAVFEELPDNVFAEAYSLALGQSDQTDDDLAQLSKLD